LGPVWGYGTTLPWWMQSAPWGGDCTFTKAGTDRFHSGVDANKMKGTVVVHEAATPTRPAPPAVIEAHDSAGPARNWFQDAAGDATHSSVTIKASERVTFAYPAGASSHNVTFPNAPKGASCPQTKASPQIPFLDPDEAPPLPGFAQPFGWEGYRTFDAAGTYTFVCSTHPRDDGHGRGRVRRRADADPDGHRNADAHADRDADVHPGDALRDRRARLGEPGQELVPGRVEQRPVHLHGGVTEPQFDGHPHDAFASGTERLYEYPNVARSATLWYHDDAHGETAKTLFAGLAAFYILEDPNARRSISRPATTTSR
jgi:plastocyanin